MSYSMKRTSSHIIKLVDLLISVHAECRLGVRDAVLCSLKEMMFVSLQNGMLPEGHAAAAGEPTRKPVLLHAIQTVLASFIVLDPF